jgi:hypothetical protein
VKLEIRRAAWLALENLAGAELFSVHAVSREEHSADRATGDLAPKQEFSP